jgi:hypothetical protein
VAEEFKRQKVTSVKFYIMNVTKEVMAVLVPGNDEDSAWMMRNPRLYGVFRRLHGVYKELDLIQRILRYTTSEVHFEIPDWAIDVP